jgi:maleylacetoacetate isomerase
MKLYGYYRSSASYRVRIALYLKGVDWDYQPVHLLKNGGQQREQPYQDINPQQLVPSLLLDSGEVLNQSLAIIEFLDETYPKPPLLPTDLIHRAFCRKIAHAIAMDMQPFYNLRTLQYLTGTLALDAAAKTQWLHDWMHKGFSALEAWVSQGHYSGPFIGGSQVSLADLCLVPQLFTARRFDLALEAYPELLKIEAACQALDAFIKAKPEQQPDFEQ